MLDWNYTKEIYQTELSQYKKEVNKITKRQPLYQLEHYEKRGKGKYSLDHMISVVYGFRNKIEPEIIGNICNLRYLPTKANISKRDYLTKESFDVLAYMIELEMI